MLSIIFAFVLLLLGAIKTIKPVKILGLIKQTIDILNSNSRGQQAHRILEMSSRGYSAESPTPRRGRNTFLSPSPIKHNVKEC